MNIPSQILFFEEFVHLQIKRKLMVTFADPTTQTLTIIVAEEVHYDSQNGHRVWPKAMSPNSKLLENVLEKSIKK